LMIVLSDVPVPPMSGSCSKSPSGSSVKWSLRLLVLLNSSIVLLASCHPLRCNAWPHRLSSVTQNVLYPLVLLVDAFPIMLGNYFEEEEPVFCLVSLLAWQGRVIVEFGLKTPNEPSACPSSVSLTRFVLWMRRQIRLYFQMENKTICFTQCLGCI
jgi:hypothetical protein